MNTAELNQKGLALLRKAEVKEFNELREKNPDWIPNFRRAFLTGKFIAGVNLRGADLRDAGIENIDFRAADLRDADFRRANLWHTDFRGANIEGAFGLPKF